MRVLVLSPDPLPLPGMPVCPLGLRAWSLAFGLRSQGMADVHLACPAREGIELPPIPGLHTFRRGGEAGLLANVKPEAMVVVSAEMLAALPDAGCPVVLDVTRPRASSRGVAALRASLARADKVMCATRGAAHFVQPLLLETGFGEEVPLRVPLCVAPDMPPVLSRKGGVQIVALRLDGDYSKEERDSLRAAVNGRGDATLDVISRDDGVSLDLLLARLSRADLAVTVRPAGVARSVHPSDESLLALWAGVPVLCDGDDSLADAVTTTRAGWVCEEDAGRQVARLLTKAEDVRRRAPRASELVRSGFTWDRAIGPLVGWLDAGAPVRRKASVPAAAHREVPAGRATRARKGEVSAARSPLGRISYAPPMVAPERATPLNMGLTIIAMALLLPIGLMLLALFGLAELMRHFAVGGPAMRDEKR